ncbi:hypothetical protein F5X99DRAFT_404408 [Biscogniauxia marginata]|nr:hypothetical protein F5X99DRAFT_404408 [Biscogniauxia marginata]
MPWAPTSSSPAESGRIRENESWTLGWIKSWINSPFTIVFHVLFAIVVVLLASTRSSLVTRAPSMSDADTCVSHDSPNPHALQYPELISGTLNGTTLIVPIPLTQARMLIPSKYRIAESVYRSLLPSFPEGMYPMVAQIVHDHDIQFPAYNASLPDFSRASFEFPFVDVLGTGHSSFRWAGTMLISASNQMAIDGSRSYGMSAHAAAFDPPCDAYRALPDGSTFAHSRGMPEIGNINADANDTQSSSSSSSSSSSTTAKFMTLETRPLPEAAAATIPYPLDFVRNVTNQPVFAGDAAKCDYYQRLFDTALTTGSNAPVPVSGRVSANLEPFAAAQSWGGGADAGVFGWRLATAFLEPPAVEECR